MTTAQERTDAGELPAPSPGGDPGNLPNVYQAIATAALNAETAGLDARNDFDKYDYRSIRGVMDAAHTALAKAGVVVVLHEMRDVQRTSVQTQKGGHQTLITYIGVFRVYGPRGDFLELVNYCEGMDRGDKAANKASSAGYKEVLQKLLTLPFGHEEAERDSPELAPPQQQPRGNGRQRQAVDNTPPKQAKPWDGKPDYRIPYKTETQVYVQLNAQGMPQLAEVGKLRNEDLTKLEQVIPKRQEHFHHAKLEGMVACCARDFKLVTGELLARQTMQPTPMQEKHGPAKDSQPKDSQSSPGSNAGASDAAAASPADLQLATVVPHLGVPKQPDMFPTAKQLDNDEVLALCTLTPAEVLAIAAHPENAALFKPADGPAIRAHNTAEAPVFSGGWLARPWLKTMEADKRRTEARRLLRMAILTLQLYSRIELPDTPLNLTLRPITADEHAQLMEYGARLVEPGQAIRLLADALAAGSAGSPQEKETTRG